MPKMSASLQHLIADGPNLVVGVVGEMSDPREWDQGVGFVELVHPDRPVAVECKHHHGFCLVFWAIRQTEETWY